MHIHQGCADGRAERQCEWPDCKLGQAEVGTRRGEARQTCLAQFWLSGGLVKGQSLEGAGGPACGSGVSDSFGSRVWAAWLAADMRLETDADMRLETDTATRWWNRNEQGE